ncbi:WNT1-inducible-signaling pathway protein 2 [Gambusia affinis]|uniref:WNT1-inducible-signaling pathway protein 2 n=1 Tax=Gambusia affinis TaxID=33528 RepID=UPI001CDC6712|nr:WNT1-inducible-signaling pathway protein 2 [Gambusia affinis]
MDPLDRCGITLAALLCVATQVLCQLCNRPCLCPASVPQCAAGVPLVPDGCRCCQVCARQRGESCSEMLPCDRQKGLQCDFSASFPGDPGECVGDEDLSCKVNGITYLNGQSFQASCDSYCHCRGGGVSCVSACPLTGRLPTPDCPSPQFVRLPGKCCREWVCENLENTVIQDAMTAMNPARSGSTMPGAPVLKQLVLPASSCGSQTKTLPRGQQGWCKASYRSPGPIRLVHHGCFSIQAYQLRYCGQCSDSRCCTPHQTSTAQVTFRCSTGRLLQKAVMMIHSCVCHNNCPYAPYTNPALWAHRP